MLLGWSDRKFVKEQRKYGSPSSTHFLEGIAGKATEVCFKGQVESVHKFITLFDTFFGFLTLHVNCI